MMNITNIRPVVSAFVTGVLITFCMVYGWQSFGQNKPNTNCLQISSVQDLGIDLTKPNPPTEKRSVSKNTTKGYPTKWEHAWEVNIGFANVNNYGNYGWELVDITTVIDNDQLEYIYFFKRAL